MTKMLELYFSLNKIFLTLFFQCFFSIEAFLRIQAARLVRHSPEVIGLLEDNKATLTTLKLIAPHMTPQNKEKILKEVEHKTKRETEHLVATLFPSEEIIGDTIRKLPTPGIKTAQNLTRSGTSTLVKKEAIKPLTSKRFKIEFSASETLTKKIQRAKELLRHKYPQGKLEDILDEALELLLEKKDPERKINRISGKEKSNDVKSETRYIPQVLQREIFKRDEGKCSYVSPEGKHCGEKNFLELDHVKPWSLGGDSTAENLRLLWRAHNQYRKEKTFGIRY